MSSRKFPNGTSYFLMILNGIPILFFAVIFPMAFPEGLGEALLATMFFIAYFGIHYICLLVFLIIIVIQLSNKKIERRHGFFNLLLWAMAAAMPFLLMEMLGGETY